MVDNALKLNRPGKPSCAVRSFSRLGGGLKSARRLRHHGFFAPDRVIGRVFAIPRGSLAPFQPCEGRDRRHPIVAITILIGAVSAFSAQRAVPVRAQVLR